MVLAAGCSGPGGGPACHTVSTYDCLKPLVAEAMPCGHPFSTSGTWDGAYLNCSYADGTVVTFSGTPLMSSPTTPPWSFTIKKNGTTCLSVEVTGDASGNVTTTNVTTSGGVYQEVDNIDPLHLDSFITCPNGVTFSENEARACHAAPTHIGYGYEGIQTMVQFTLGTQGSTTQSFQVLQCGP
jgi:hypothetical protein